MAEHDNFCEIMLTGNCKPYDKKNDVTLSRDTSCDKIYRGTNRVSDKSHRLDNLRRALPGITETSRTKAIANLATCFQAFQMLLRIHNFQLSQFSVIYISNTEIVYKFLIAKRWLWPED